jgi:hypothetical protein
MSPAGFEPTVPATERPQTHALDRTATGIGDDTKHVRHIVGSDKICQPASVIRVKMP